MGWASILVCAITAFLLLLGWSLARIGPISDYWPEDDEDDKGA